MTLVEFYGRDPVDNVISALTLRPDKIIFMGNKSEINSGISSIQNVLLRRVINPVIECCIIVRNDAKKLISTLSRIIEENAPCTFDITGGEDTLLFAFGRVVERYQASDIQVHWFNIHNRNIADFDSDGILPVMKSDTLTVEEQISLYGGSVVYDNQKPGATYRWDFNEEFVCDVKTMWDICREDCSLWNYQTTMLGDLEQFSTTDSTDLFFQINIPFLHEYLHDHGYTVSFSGILSKLERSRVIHHYQLDTEYLSFHYKNLQIKRCLTKAGTVLELITYLTASDITDKKGTKIITDAMTGVYIDWDGNIHDKDSGVADVDNEIDVVLMKGLVPVFISCKNGIVTTDELYKLNTVAKRFGNHCAKKVLICSKLHVTDDIGNKKNSENFRARAKAC